MNITPAHKSLSIILLLSVLLIFTSGNIQAEYTEVQDDTRISAYALAVEGDFIYIAGDATGLSGQLPDGSLDLSGSMQDVWLVKMRSDGTPVYQAIIGGSNDDTAYSLAVRQGVVYLSGETWSDDFPGAPGNAGEDDAFVMALAADGSRVLWARRFGGSDQDSGRALALRDQSLYLTGVTWSQDFVPGLAKGDADGFLARMDLSGALQWMQVYGGRSLDASNALAVNDNAVWVAGQTFSNNFGGPYHGGGDAFAARFTLNGIQETVRLYGGREDDMAFAIALTADGGAYLTGATQSTQFSDAGGSFSGSIDSYVLKIDSSGQALNTEYLGGTGFDYGYDVSVLPGGDALIVGSTTSPQFPIGYGKAPASFGGEDAFIVHFSPSNGIQSVLLKGGENDERALRAAFSSNGLWLAGRFSNDTTPHSLFVPATELQGILLPTPVSLLPTATLALTATSQPTETPIPTATSTLMSGVTQIISNTETSQPVENIKATDVKMTATQEVSDSGVNPTQSATPATALTQTKITQGSEPEIKKIGSQFGWLIPGLVIFTLLIYLAYRFVWNKDNKLKK